MQKGMWNFDMGSLSQDVFMNLFLSKLNSTCDVIKCFSISLKAVLRFLN